MPRASSQPSSRWYWLTVKISRYLSAVTLLCSAGCAALANDEVPPPFADIRVYGALGDGAADDTEAFQAAVESGLPVLIPASKNGYVITRPVLIPPGTSILGVGKAMSLVRCKSQVSCFSTGSTGSSRSDRTLFRDFTILGEGTFPTVGIRLIRSRRSAIENVLIRDIGGTGIIIDGLREGSAAQSHYTFIQNAEIAGTHRIGLQIRGRKAGEGSNRHRIFFLRVNGSSDIAVDIWKKSGTSAFFGLAAENVHTAVRVAGRRNVFFGLNVELAKHGVEFLPTARNNLFYGPFFADITEERWVNDHFNTTDAATDRPDFVR